MITDELEKEITTASSKINKIKSEISKRIVGQDYLIRGLLTGLFCNQHVLVEGVPGLAKTLTIKTLSDILSVDFQRIQFTPDLLPGDLIGTQIFNPSEGGFSIKKGPLFSNFILADEINRAPAKVQSALLEAMQERQITIGDETFTLAEPFIVMATQNPIEQEGTYPLPEAQVDRFMLKLKIDYPTRDEEVLILRKMAVTSVDIPVEVTLKREEIIEIRKLIDKVYIDPRVEEYIVDIMRATRTPSEYGLDMDAYILYGASPRALIFMTLAAKCRAFMEGRAWASPEDVQIMAPDVLRHRVVPSYEAEADGVTSEELVSRIFAKVKLP
ncbi:MAG: AAA family ATPase [Spirochaetales bacterium]|nr:AAA family ATPase [Spirochaetales bacterium]